MKKEATQDNIWTLNMSAKASYAVQPSHLLKAAKLPQEDPSI